MGRGLVEVGQKEGGILGRRRALTHGDGHMLQPCVALAGPDREREVAHAQPRMAATAAVLGRAAPVLGQEPGQVRLSRIQIVGIDRAQLGVGLDPGVEAVDERDEERLAADAVIERCSQRRSRIRLMRFRSLPIAFSI